MNNVLVDNWYMEQVVADIRAGNRYHSVQYAELLSAIVLWDNIYYPDNEHNWWHNHPSEVQHALLPLKDNSTDPQFLRSEQLLMSQIASSLKGTTFYTDNVAKSALHYRLLSNQNECDYLPCPPRQEFLKKIDKNVLFAKLARLNFSHTHDKLLREYYLDAYHGLINTDIVIDRPILSNFIIHNTPESMTPVDYAIHLANEGPVLRYRDYLARIESCIENQEFAQLRLLLKESRDVVDEVLRMDNDSIPSLDMTIFPTPSISIGMEFKFPKKKMHLTFLRDLTEYATNELLMH